jgi:hypothetical protein
MTTRVPRAIVDLPPGVTTVQLHLASADGQVQLMDVATGRIVYRTPADDLERAQRRAMQWAHYHHLGVLWQ